MKKATSNSPAPESHAASLKRRASTATQNPPPESKRAKTEDDGKDDPVRKYCLSKLEEVLKAIFLESLAKDSVPAMHVIKEEGVAGDSVTDIKDTPGEASPSVEPPKPEETNDVEDRRKELVEKASTFTTELERCMFDAYAEPDKHGRPHASGKYKYVSNQSYTEL
jgi:hypothetical protein